MVIRSNPASDMGRGLILLVLVLLAYSPVGSAGFVWDDQGFIVSNPNLQGWDGLKRLWTTGAADVGPLTFSTFWLEHAVWGTTPLPFHLVTLLFHGLNAVLVWRILLRLAIPGAWFGAALWALHPVQVESVAWIMELKNTQSGFFFLLSILSFLHQRRGQYAVTIFFAALAMASKSSTVILPIVLCLCAWWMEGPWRWRNLMTMVPLFALSLLAGFASLWTLRLKQTSVDLLSIRPWPERIAEAGHAVWFYLGKLIWPFQLSNNYPLWQFDVGHVSAYGFSLTLVMVLGIFWSYRETWARPFFFAFAYFVFALLPVLGFLDNPIFRYSQVFDHFQYLASMGPLALAAAGLGRLADIVAKDKTWFQSSLGGGILLLVGFLTWQRCWVFQSEETLWSDALRQNPASWAAYNNLGLVYFHRSNVDAAVAAYQKSLALNPNNAEAHSNLGGALLKLGQVDAAEKEYRLSLALNLAQDQPHQGLGQVAAQAGRMSDAIAEYDAALGLNPNSAGTHTNLGVALFRAGHPEEAMVHFQRALELDPDLDEAHNNMGNALLSTGHLDDAISQYQEALRLNPEFADAHQNLGVAFARRGQLGDAIAQFQALVRLRPGDVQAQKILAQLEAAAHR